jgi:DnaJ-class molecular chaperone
MRVPSILPILFCLDIVVTRFSDTLAFLPTHQHSHSHSHKAHQQSHHDRVQQLSSAATSDGASSLEEDVADVVTLTENVDLKKTLYDVLRGSPTDTRTELKKCYVAMAKKYHPDALTSAAMSNAKDGTPISASPMDDSIDFSEIAAAWRVLSDPKQRKRYDRTLQAEQFSQDVTALASQWGKQAGPAAKIFETVAIPFIRRTTATTLASFQAAANDLNQQQKISTVDTKNVDNVDTKMDHKGAEVLKFTNDSDADMTAGSSTHSTTSSGIKSGTNSTTSASRTHTTTQPQQQQPDFSRAFKSAMAAARRAGRYVDSMELTEKSEELIARAHKGAQEAEQLQVELQKLAAKRLQMVLHTPGSGLTSADAGTVLEDFNNTVTDLDQLSMWDKLSLKNTVAQEIEELQMCELDFVEMQAMETRDQLEYQKNVLARLSAQSSLAAAVKKEEALRLALDEAQQEAAAQKQALELILRNFTAAEQLCRKSQHDKSRATRLMEKQSERVRAALREKERAVFLVKGLSEDDAVPDSVTEEEFENRLQELLEIRQEEKKLVERSAHLEEVAARLLSRANKLKISSEEMQKMQ